jgi:hypothetical protein
LKKYFGKKKQKFVFFEKKWSKVEQMGEEPHRREESDDIQRSVSAKA